MNNASEKLVLTSTWCGNPMSELKTPCRGQWQVDNTFCVVSDKIADDTRSQRGWHAQMKSRTIDEVR